MPPRRCPSQKPTVAQTVEKARGLELEQTHGVRGLDEFEGEPVVEVDVVGVVEVDLAAGGAADLGDGVRHRRLHPHAQDVELEQSEVFDVLLVGLHHRVAARGGLHRQPLQQTRVGQDDAAGVHGVAAGQRVQPLGQLPQRPELPGPGGKLAQFRQLGQGAADVVDEIAKSFPHIRARDDTRPPR